MSETKAAGGQERGLERERIVETALELLAEVGFSGLTLRRLAARLGVQAAALYWYFKNKQDLIDAMATRIITSEFRAVPPAAADWRALLTHVARTNRRALLLYHDGAQILAHANMPQQPVMLKGLEQLLRRLARQGFSTELSMSSFFIIIRFTLGCVFEEQADPRSSATRAGQHAYIQQLAKVYPTVAEGFKVSMAQRQHNPDWHFERGLEIILAGIQTQLDAGVQPA